MLNIFLFSATAKKQPGSYPGPDPVQKPEKEKEKEKDKENKPVKQEKIEKEEEPDKSDVSIRKNRDYFSILPVLKGRYTSHTHVCRSRVRHTQVNCVMTQMTGHHGWNSGEL